MKEFNSIRNKLFYIISHDLKAPATVQKTAMEALQPKIKKADSEKLKNSYEILKVNANKQDA